MEILKDVIIDYHNKYYRLGKKQYETNIIEILFGKKLYDNCFDTSISEDRFIELINIFEKEKKNKKFQLYSVYEIDEKKLKIFQDQSSVTFSEQNIEYKDFTKNNIINDIRFVLKTSHQLANDMFPSSYYYDNIIDIEKIVYNLGSSMKLELSKNTERYQTKNIFDNDNNTSYFQAKLVISGNHIDIDKIEKFINLLNTLN